MTGTLTTGRYDHTAARLNNGVVLMAGGGGSSAGLAGDALHKCRSN